MLRYLRKIRSETIAAFHLWIFDVLIILLIASLVFLEVGSKKGFLLPKKTISDIYTKGYDEGYNEGCRITNEIFLQALTSLISPDTESRILDDIKNHRGKNISPNISPPKHRSIEDSKKTGNEA